jgi:hypothetical protein
MTVENKYVELIRYCNDRACPGCPLNGMEGGCVPNSREKTERFYEIVFGKESKESSARIDPECITAIRHALNAIEEAVSYLEKQLGRM